MQHEVMPDDVAQPDVVLVPVEDLEAKAETVEDVDAICHTPGCNDEHSDIECWECHQKFCDNDIVNCPQCDDHICPSHVHNFEGTLYCSHCVACFTKCCSCGASINSEGDDTHYCEGHAAHCCDSCITSNDHCVTYDNDYDNDEDEGTTSSAVSGTRGMSAVAPWETRGVHTKNSGYPELNGGTFNHLDACVQWGIDRELSINQAAADFYLLEPVQMNLDCGEIAEPMLVVMAEEARAARASLVKIWDRQLSAYADMAIGGEIRYHQAVGNRRHLDGDRAQAWAEWQALRARGGPQILVDTAALFREIHGSSVGGERWAIATDLLHARVTGRITPEQWVDRCFTLQHNGGAFTNKIAWGPDHCESGSDIHEKIGPAHSMHPPDFETLLEFASAGAISLFTDWWPVANKNRIRWRINPWRRRNRELESQLRQTRLYFRHFVMRGWSAAATMQEYLNQWDAQPEWAAARFNVLNVGLQIGRRFGIPLRWQLLDPALGRRIVRHTLDHHQLMPQYATLHVDHPDYVEWLCSNINIHAAYCTPAFKYLLERGVTIPVKYHKAAGLVPAQLGLLDSF